MHRKIRCTAISSPSLVGQSVILNQAVLLAPVHRFSAPSRGFPSGTMQRHSLLQWRDRVGFDRLPY